VEEHPRTLDGAVVLSSASLVGLKPSERSVVLMDGVPIPTPSSLAVCQYSGESDFYLFHCATDGSVLGAGHFQSLDVALASAEDAYPGVSERWVNRG
jgi:hypothetical protein